MKNGTSSRFSAATALIFEQDAGGEWSLVGSVPNETEHVRACLTYARQAQRVGTYAAVIAGAVDVREEDLHGADLEPVDVVME